MGATSKQIRFIGHLMDEREIMDDDHFQAVYMSSAAQAVRCGQGDLLTCKQASNFIGILLTCQKKKEA